MMNNDNKKEKNHEKKPVCLTIDRYHVYFRIRYCEETAKYLYEQYTPITVAYKIGTLPTYEKLVQKHVSGLKSDRKPAVMKQTSL